MSQTPVGFGFFGAGQIAPVSAAAIRRHPQARLVAAHDLHAARLREFCEAEGIPRAHDTAAGLLEDREVDAVYIAVPNKFHAPLAIQALEAGKHVLLEKPFAMDLAEAREVAATARRTGRIFNVGMNQRFGRPVQVAKALIERGELGEIYHAKAAWMRRVGIPKLGTWFGNRSLAGAGCLYDIGVHFLDLALYLLDDFAPVSVSAATYTRFGHLGRGGGAWGKSGQTGLPFDVDDFATGLIRFADGGTLALDVSWACHAGTQEWGDVQLYGSEAGALVQAGKLFRPGSVPGEYLVVEGTDAPIRYPHGDRFHNFINHLLGEEELCVTVEQALAVQKILDALRQSAATRREVELSPVPDAGTS